MKLIFTTLVMLCAAVGAKADTQQYNIRVDGMTCPFCVATSEKELKKISGVRTVAADLEQGLIFVCTDDAVQFTDAQLQKLFLSKGFTFREFTKVSVCSIEDGQ